MIERGSARVALRVDQNEFRTTGGGLAIPKPARLLNPMRIYIRDIGQMPQVSRKKLLRPLVVFRFSLRKKSRRQKNKQYRKGPTCAELHPWFSSPALQTGASQRQ